MERPGSRGNDAGKRPSNTSRRESTTSKDKTSNLRPAKRLSISMTEAKRSSNSHQQTTRSQQYSPRPVGGSPITLTQPNPPLTSERKRRMSAPYGGSRPVSSHEQPYVRFEHREPKPSPEAHPQRRNSTYKHGQHTPQDSRDMGHWKLPTGERRASFVGDHLPPSPTAWRQTPPHSPKQTKRSPDSVTAEAGDNPELSRFDHRAKLREMHTAKARSSDENSALSAEKAQRQELERRLKKVEAERDDLLADRKNQESDFERRLKQLELSQNRESSRSYTAEMRQPKPRQERYHANHKGNVYSQEQSYRPADGGSSRTSVRRSDEPTNTSSVRTPRSDNRTVSTASSDIEDETQEESDGDGRYHTSRKGKSHKKRR